MLSPKNSNQTIVSATRGGLGLPDRDYYLETDQRSSLGLQGRRDACPEERQRRMQIPAAQIHYGP